MDIGYGVSLFIDTGVDIIIILSFPND